MKDFQYAVHAGVFLSNLVELLEKYSSDLQERYPMRVRRADTEDRGKPSTDQAMDHILWMLGEMKKMEADLPDPSPMGFPMKVEKLMRWLGFIQGALWVLGFYSIDEMREHNRKLYVVANEEG